MKKKKNFKMNFLYQVEENALAWTLASEQQKALNAAGTYIARKWREYRARKQMKQGKNQNQDNHKQGYNQQVYQNQNQYNQQENCQALSHPQQGNQWSEQQQNLQVHQQHQTPSNWNGNHD